MNFIGYVWIVEIKRDETYMYIILVILWTISLVILITNRKSSSNRWIAATAFVGGFAGLGSLIGDVLVPNLLINYVKNPDIISNMQSLARGVFSVSCYFFYPYLMFALNYCRLKFFNNYRMRYITAIILFLPLLLIFFMYPLDSYYKPKTILIVIFNVVYVMIANILLFISYFKEVSPKLKREKLLLLYILVPVTTLSSILGNLMHYLGYTDMWKQEIWLFLYLAVVFFVFSSKWGIIGIRIIFQDTEFHNTMSTINTGVLTIDHALKNETMKIETCVENLKSTDAYKDDEVKWNIKIIQNSISHLKGIADKVKGKVKQVETCKKASNLADLIQNALNRVDVYRKGKSIVTNFVCNSNITVMCDPVLIEEALVNIFANSIEAMKNGGILAVNVSSGSDMYIIKISDNGSGIPKEIISKVFDPFFSTKNPDTNYGLGLSYCYSVLKKHAWNIELESQPNKGTTVYITIPRSGILTKAV